MRTASYLIEFRFHGYAKKYLKNLIFDVSNKFKVRGVTRKHVVPHITLYGPFYTNNESEMVSRIISICKKYEDKIINFKLKGFSRIGNKVICIDVEPSEELKNLRRDISKILLPVSKAQPWDSEHDFIFHGTIAFKDIQHKFGKIWSYIDNIEEPNINQNLLRVTVIKNAKILCEYDLIQKNCLIEEMLLINSYIKKQYLSSKTMYFLKVLYKISVYAGIIYAKRKRVCLNVNTVMIIFVRNT